MSSEIRATRSRDRVLGIDDLDRDTSMIFVCKQTDRRMPWEDFVSSHGHRDHFGLGSLLILVSFSDTEGMPRTIFSLPCSVSPKCGMHLKDATQPFVNVHTSPFALFFQICGLSNP